MGWSDQLANRQFAAKRVRMTQIRPAKLADAIAGHIQTMILEGALQPGERLLSERDLSSKLQVSRPSLRDALDKLIEKGLLRTDPQGASYVSEDLGRTLRDPLVLLLEDPDARFDYLEYRTIVEGEAAAFAAQRASEVDLEQIRGTFERMRIAHERGDSDEHARADADFHLAIYEASHNLVLLHLMTSLEGILRSDVYLNRRNLYEQADEGDSLYGQHQAICEAILARDPVAARAAAQAHVTQTLNKVREVRDAERRLEVSLRRLERRDLIAPDKRARVG